MLAILRAGLLRRLGSGVAALALLGCDSDAHIRLFEPSEQAPRPGMDASTPAPQHRPEAGLPPPRDAGRSPTFQPPEREPQSGRDSGPPPSTSMEAGAEPTAAFADSLVLRYDFSGDGDIVPDLVGDNDARLLGGTTLSPDRTFIPLDGQDDYVDIPNGVVSGLHSATFVAWVRWDGGVCWQRIFDFGISDQGEDEVGNSVTSLFMTPLACGRNSFTAMAELGSVQDPVADDEPLPTGFALQVALVVDADAQTFALYRDADKVGEASTSFQLGQLTDSNNWLGRSQWAQDAFFSGAIGEFRIYSRALSAEEIALVRAEGFEAQ